MFFHTHWLLVSHICCKEIHYYHSIPKSSLSVRLYVTAVYLVNKWINHLNSNLQRVSRAKGEVVEPFVSQEDWISVFTLRSSEVYNKNLKMLTWNLLGQSYLNYWKPFLLNCRYHRFCGRSALWLQHYTFPQKAFCCCCCYWGPVRCCYQCTNRFYG